MAHQENEKNESGELAEGSAKRGMHTVKLAVLLIVFYTVMVAGVLAGANLLSQGEGGEGSCPTMKVGGQDGKTAHEMGGAWSEKHQKCFYE